MVSRIWTIEYSGFLERFWGSALEFLPDYECGYCMVCILRVLVVQNI